MPSRTWAACAVVAILVSAPGCGGGGKSSPSGPPTAAGRFIDGPVQGLHFASGGQSGTTGADGSYTYEVGQQVTFSLGGILLGTVAGKAIVTPVDLVPTASATAPESDPKVVKIVQFLMTIDGDGDPGNGIAIPASVQAAAVGQTLDFATATDATLAAFLHDRLGVTAPLVSSASAAAHARESILGLYAGAWSGTYGSGTATLGTWNLAIAADGGMSGTFVDNADGPGTLTGTARANSTFTIQASNGDAVTGTIDPAAGIFSGTLAASGGTGWFRGARGGPSGQVATPTFSPAPGTYTSGQAVAIATATPGATIRYTVDGAAPSETVGTLYSGPVAMATTTTLKVIAYRTGWTSSAIATGTWTIAVASVVAAPTFSPPPGTYTSAQQVALSTATAGATIRYTTDGSSPTESAGTVYGAPVAVASSSTLKAVAYRTGWTTSTVTSADYVITSPPASSALVAAGTNYFLASSGDGLVHGIGSNAAGTLGDGTTTARAAWVQASGLTDVAKLAAANGHSLALKSDGTVWEWGYDVARGLSKSPAQVPGLTGVVSIAAGSYFSLVAKADGTVWGWGNNTAGELGDGTLLMRATPVQATGVSGVLEVACGYAHSLARKADGTVWAWGGNGNGQLGDGTVTSRSTPAQVVGLTGAVGIAAGYGFSAMLKGDGTVWTFGVNGYGTLARSTTGTSNQSPGQASGIGGVVALAAGHEHLLAVRSDGTLWAWGRNEAGQLGIGNVNTPSGPVQVPGLAAVTAVAAYEANSLAALGDGTYWAWGTNFYGQLGDGTTTTRTSPVRLPAF